ncbi:AI-2E family transporter [Schaalia sp. 19OD2882]|uniref:AI-2E family transporter n=1 Tax=Schaalia sp. 19OD2882 TaxID=2794089 RepID=UPI001C1EEC96|nr:AI-2E family transporter [Schaalia sp. 19OD2882]QWW20199.1 AI-2E family transporter [Schaalia sp. 19OD2882]
MSAENSRQWWGFADLLDRIVTQRPERRKVDERGPAIEFHASESLRDESAQSAVPWSLRVAAAMSWRAIVVAAAAAGLAWIAVQLSFILLPLAIALLLAVLISPMVEWMHRRLRFPRALAAALGLVITLAVVVATLSGAGTEIALQVPDLIRQANLGLTEAIEWIKSLPLNIDTSALDHIQRTVQVEVTAWLQKNSQTVASGALSVTSSVISLLSGLAMTLFCLFFLLKDGRRIWIWVVRMLPEPARVPVHESAIRGWVTLGAYVRGQIQVAAIDAVSIGIGAAFLGIPMAVPITVVVFFGSFVPIVGALVSGSIAVLVALVSKGLTAGVIMLVVILVVQQVEGNLLQPFIMSNAVSLHPMAVLLVVAGCGAVAGIPGAVFGVPVAAFLNATMLYLHGYDPVPELATKKDRPGGAPGHLAEMIRSSYKREGAAPVVMVAEAPLDANGDGVVDEEEAAAAQERARLKAAEEAEGARPLVGEGVAPDSPAEPDQSGGRVN